MTLCLSVNVQHTLIQFLHASNLNSLSMRGQNRYLIRGTTIARRAAFAALVRCVRSISGATFPILMKRVAKILLLFVTAASLWIYALCDCFPVKLSPTHQFWVHVVCASHLFRFATTALIMKCIAVHAQSPLYALVVFGCYSLWSIGYNMLTFRDCDDSVLAEMHAVCFMPSSFTSWHML